MRRKGLVSLVGTIVVTVALLAWSLLAGSRPFLGLDLQGGVAVILTPSAEATDEQLEDAVAIIRSRVDALGVAEPEITRQGQNISVEIPGVTNREQAIDLVGQTGELTFRPVIEQISTGFEVDADGNPVLAEPEVEVTPTEPGTEGGDGSTTTTSPDTTAPGGGDGEGSLAPIGPVGWVPGESAAVAQDPTTPPDSSVPPATEIDPAQLQQLVDAQAGGAASAAGFPELTPDPAPDQEAVLPEYRTIDGKRFEVARFRLGPASLTGSGLESATASLDERGQWTVRPTFKPGAEGIDAFNETAAACFAKTAVCPSGLFAITLDNAVISALGVQAPSFSRDQIVISGSFDEQQAKDLGTVLRYGALPVKLEIQSVQEVSATLGSDALRAGVIAGGIGLLLVAVYMLAFYRLLGVTAVVKLLIELALLWVIIAWLGTSQGLALTLAGVAAIVVSFGLSVDSNVVFFETIKEDLRSGRSLRTAAEKSFTSAWGTIVKADLASLIAAVLLYFLAVGPVRGFAFYLGLATVLDLIACWFFMRPAGVLSLRSGLCQRHPRWFSLPATAAVATTPRMAKAAPGSGTRTEEAGSGEPEPDEIEQDDAEPEDAGIEDIGLAMSQGDTDGVDADADARSQPEGDTDPQTPDREEA